MRNNIQKPISETKDNKTKQNILETLKQKGRG